METLRKLLNHRECIGLLFLFCTALFGWPFISITGPSSPETMFVYLFFVWGAVIVMLYFISRQTGPETSGHKPGSEN